MNFCEVPVVNRALAACKRRGMPNPFGKPEGYHHIPSSPTGDRLFNRAIQCYFFINYDNKLFDLDIKITAACDNSRMLLSGSINEIEKGTKGAVTVINSLGSFNHELKKFPEARMHDPRKFFDETSVTRLFHRLAAHSVPVSLYFWLFKQVEQKGAYAGHMVDFDQVQVQLLRELPDNKLRKTIGQEMIMNAFTDKGRKLPDTLRYVNDVLLVTVPEAEPFSAEYVEMRMVMDSTVNIPGEKNN
jgi:hypothetical protein